MDVLPHGGRGCPVRRGRSEPKPVRRHITGHHGPQSDERARADGDVLTHANGATDVCTRLHSATAAKADSGCERREVTDAAIVCDDHLRHDRNVALDLGVRGHIDVGEQDRALPDDAGRAHGRAWVHERRIAVVFEVESLRDRATARVVARMPGAQQDQSRRMVVYRIDGSKHRNASNRSAVCTRVIVKEAEQAPRRLVGVRTAHRFRDLPAESACSDQQQIAHHLQGRSDVRTPADLLEATVREHILKATRCSCGGVGYRVARRARFALACL